MRKATIKEVMQINSIIGDEPYENDEILMVHYGICDNWRNSKKKLVIGIYENLIHGKPTDPPETDMNMYMFTMDDNGQNVQIVQEKDFILWMQ